MAVAVVSGPYGGAAAETAAPSAAAAIQPVQLAGRWSGQRYGLGLTGKEAECTGKACNITFDIVACDTGWCGIRIADDESCGAVGLRLADNPKKPNVNRFSGKLELAKGTAPYVVEAWYMAGDAGDKPHLSFVGDTGPELLMMRRSFPFEAQLDRIADATCTLQKATS